MHKLDAEKEKEVRKDSPSKPKIIISAEDVKEPTKEKKAFRLHINDESINDELMFDIPQADYMPFYNALQLNTSWWLQTYEPCRNKQNQREKRHLAQKNPKTFPSLSAPSPHHNESINLALKDVKSLYNVQANEVLKQLECIEKCTDIKLKPIKVCPVYMFAMHDLSRRTIKNCLLTRNCSSNPIQR